MQHRADRAILVLWLQIPHLRTGRKCEAIIHLYYKTPNPVARCLDSIVYVCSYVALSHN